MLGSWFFVVYKLTTTDGAIAFFTNEEGELLARKHVFIETLQSAKRIYRDMCSFGCCSLQQTWKVADLSSQAIGFCLGQ